MKFDIGLVIRYLCVRPIAVNVH